LACRSGRQSCAQLWAFHSKRLRLLIRFKRRQSRRCRGRYSYTGATIRGLSSAAQTQPEEQAIGTFKSPNSGTYAQWVAVTEPPPAAQFKRGLHLSKQPRRNVVAHRSDTLGWRIGVLTGRVSKKPRSPKDKPIAGLYKVVYPDMPALETHDLLPTSYGVNSRWVFLQQPGALC
jgi:hypothetical protein